MKYNDYWKMFEYTGKISDYLSYKEKNGQVYTKSSEIMQAGESNYDTAYHSNSNGFIGNAGRGLR